MNLRNITSVLAALKEKRGDRIIGGREAMKARFSYSVSLKDDWGSFCGGSLIAPDVILSAAHCAGGDYIAIIGRHDLDTNEGDEVKISSEIVHDDYDPMTTDNDFMVLILERPTTAKVSFVELNSNESFPEVGDECIVMGWGDTTQDDYTVETSDVLMEVSVNVISNEDCAKSKGEHNGYKDSYDGFITENMLCAADEDEDSCQGDSGGPLVVRTGNSATRFSGTGESDVLVGVVSWGVGCASNIFPGVYARVSSQYDWIRKKVCKFSSNPPASFRCVQSRDPSGNTTYSELEWDALTLEDFRSGYGFMYDVDKRTAHYKFLKGRIGVIRMRDLGDDTFNSRKLVFNSTTYTMFKVSLDMYALEMTDEDEFCLQVSRDSGVTWTTESCIDDNADFESNVWYSPEVEFKADLRETTLMIRFSNTGSVLLDKVDVFGWEGFGSQS